MGSPSSPVIADKIIEILEEEVIKKTLVQITILLEICGRYSTAVPEYKVDQL